jgi:ATP-dependent metalloprotease
MRCGVVSASPLVSAAAAPALLVKGGGLGGLRIGRLRLNRRACASSPAGTPKDHHQVDGDHAPSSPSDGTAATQTSGQEEVQQSETPVSPLYRVPGVPAYAAIEEVLKLTVWLPIKFLFLEPLRWALTRLGLLAINPAQTIERLESTNKAKPVTAAQVTEVLRALNRHHPDAVVDFVESKCLWSKTDSTSNESVNEYAVDASVVKEYMTALVKSGKIKDYGGDDEAEGALGESSNSHLRPHRSLPRLLSELQAAAKGRPLPASPGSTVAWPLHVVIQQGAASATRNGGLLDTLQSWVGFLATCFLLGAIWMLGGALVQRYAASSSSSSTSHQSLPQAGTSIGGSPSGMFSQPKEYSKENLPEKSVKSFKDVKGCDEAITELQEIVEYLKSPEKFTKLGGTLPKGVLLTGPPGTGKTLLARAVAGEAGVPFFYKAGSEFDEVFVGVGSRRVRSLFATAKKKSPCIVFIDEIDAVGGKRTQWDASGGSRRTLNQLLTEIDGFEQNSGVVVIAATNTPELLDSALTRPGRFDRHVAVALPDVKGRREILQLYLAGKPLASDVDADLLARRTPGFSGAQLYNLVNEAALLAARQERDIIEWETLDEARDKVLMGSPRALTQSEEARRLTAYHEGGHALVALHTPGAKPIHKATIVPRGHALGMVSQVPENDEYSTTKRQMLAHIDVYMGGKAAEELVFGPDAVTSGATSDLKTATRMARHMVQDCGMSERIGPVALSAMDDYMTAGSEAMKVVDEEVALLLKEAYARVATLLRNKEADLHALAGALLEKETMTQAEIKELLGMVERPVGPIGVTEPEKVPVLAGSVVERK